MLNLGDAVTVGPAFHMAMNAPFSGRGEFIPDAWTGRTLSVAKVEGADIGLAPLESQEPTEDVVVWINVSRLSLR